jgi:hypothetical protein
VNESGDTECPLSPPERRRTQRRVIIGNLFANISVYIVTGAVMVLYANDVLGYSAKRIAAIVGIAPLVVVLRVPLFGLIRERSLKRVLVNSLRIRAAVVLVMLLLPAKWLSFPLFLGLVTLFIASQTLGAQAVWQPFLRQITTTEDRGSFFGRMRFSFNLVTAAVTMVITVFIGSAVSELEYKCLLGLALFGILNQQFWLSGVPDPSLPPEPLAPGDSAWRATWRQLRDAPLLRRPLAVVLLLALLDLPLFIVYLRQMLHFPSNLLTLFTLMVALGNAATLVFWGKVADALGFRPVLVGLLCFSLLLKPALILLLGPLPEAAWTFDTLDRGGQLSLLALLALGLFNGMMAAGTGIASISIQHFHVGREESVVALNAVNIATVLLNAALAWFSGFLLQDLAMPAGSHPVLGGLVHLDWIKAYWCLFAPAVTGLLIWQALKLPNARPYFGVPDFFASLAAAPVRTLFAQRHRFHEEDERRAELAHWLGTQRSPLALDPLLELLGDPDFDVRVEAVRGLARTGSPAAGEKLLALLANPRQEVLADHVAWALGELRYTPAYDELVRHLGPERTPREQAMAARALGKLGDPRAVPELVALLQRSPDHPLVAAACCRALLRLHADDQAPLVLNCLERLPDREEKYELLNVLCDWLAIPSAWLLRATLDQKITDMLLAEADLQGAAWQRRHDEALSCCRQRDLARLKELLAGALRARPQSPPAAHALAHALAPADRWTATATLAAAWLLFGQEA